MSTALVWFRQDLRLADNPALHHAVSAHDAVVPVYLWAPDEEGDWAPGGAHRWWLHQSLQSLGNDLREKGSRLVLREGPSLEALRDLARATGAGAVYFNKCFEPALRARDLEVAHGLRDDGLSFDAFDSATLHDPDLIQTGSGGPYHVYTPFWKKLKSELDVRDPLPVPRMGQTKAPSSWPKGDALGAFGLTPEAQDGVDWAGGMRETWAPGEAGAHERLERLLGEALIDYDEQRDYPATRGTSMLSPHLHWGEISPRQVWTRVQGWVQNGAMQEAAEAFLSEIAWREFSYHLLYHYPKTPGAPLKDKFEAFPWRRNQTRLERWRRGQTGYPIVDAGMRQLWHIGWMHNRVRMIVASFLTKDLLIPWQDGAQWFWDTLVGGDLANNTMGWQWSAGCGADAQPFFRIFNPVSQGERYDPDGAYVRQWIPELEDLPKKYIHKPWEAPDDVLADAGVTLGETYPKPIVDHSVARDQALDAYQEVRGSGS